MSSPPTPINLTAVFKVLPLYVTTPSHSETISLPIIHDSAPLMSSSSTQSPGASLSFTIPLLIALSSIFIVVLAFLVAWILVRHDISSEEDNDEERGRGEASRRRRGGYWVAKDGEDRMEYDGDEQDEDEEREELLPVYVRWERGDEVEEGEEPPAYDFWPYY